MKNLFYSSLLTLIAVFQAVASNETPAGVIIYSETAQGVDLLLADHTPPSKRGWAAFGGAPKPGESIADTAARETEEETRGYFKRADILKAIKTQPPILDGSFALYFVRVDHFPIGYILKAPIPSDNSIDMERGPFAWIPYSEIERLLSSKDTKTPLRIDARYLPADANTDWIWPVWIHNISVAIKVGSLPWKKAKIAPAGATVPLVPGAQNSLILPVTMTKTSMSWAIGFDSQPDTGSGETRAR